MKISVIVKPNSKKGDSVQPSESGLQVFLRAKAADNAANQALIVVLAQYYKVPKTCVEIVSGKKSRHKIVQIFTNKCD